MPKKYKIIYVSGTRADFGYFSRTLKEIASHPKMDLLIIATSQHNNPAFGLTVKEITKQGFKVKKVKDFASKNDLAAMINSLNINITEILKIFQKEKPDALVLTGDRGESLAAAITASHLNIPIFHQGGGNFSGSIDNKIRWAISVLSDYHFPSNKILADNLTKSPFFKKAKVFNIGGPTTDDIFLKNYLPAKQCLKKFHLSAASPIIVFIQHPNTQEYLSVEKQIKTSFNALIDLKYQTIALGANADAGGSKINSILQKYSQKYSFLQYYVHIPRYQYLGLLNVMDALVGNSSSGFSEAPCFKKPYICLGTRQQNRLGAQHIIRAPYHSLKIKKAIKKVLLDKAFRLKLKKVPNFYGKGNFYKKFPQILLNILEK